MKMSTDTTATTEALEDAQAAIESARAIVEALPDWAKIEQSEREHAAMCSVQLANASKRIGALIAAVQNRELRARAKPR